MLEEKKEYFKIKKRVLEWRKKFERWFNLYLRLFGQKTELRTVLEDRVTQRFLNTL